MFLKGDGRYVDVVQTAFQEGRWYGRYDVFSEPLDHLLYVQDVPKLPLERFLDFCKTTWYLTTTLDECWAMERHIPYVVHHASGHAHVKDLQKLAKAISPSRLVPIHSSAPERFVEFFDNVEQHADGEWWSI